MNEDIIYLVNKFLNSNTKNKKLKLYKLIDKCLKANIINCKV